MVAKENSQYKSQIRRKCSSVKRAIVTATIKKQLLKEED